jgi:hypothetical protein
MSLAILATTSIFAQKSKPYSQADDEVYNQIEQVKGTVTFLNHPTLGKSPASGQYLVFQRDGCKDCLIATYAGNDGKYEVFLGVGRYRLIVQEKNCGVVTVGDCLGYNLLAEDQDQYLLVEKGRPYGAEFNINIVLPKN